MIYPASWQGTIREGKVLWRDRQGVAEYIRHLEGKRVLITIEEYSSRRGLNQNAYLHVIFGLIAEETGHELFEVKDLMKRMFLAAPDRRGRMHVRGTSKLSKREMSEFIESVIRFAAQWLEIVIPPAEQCPEVWK